MRKINLIFLFIASIATSARAQYFEHLYGSTTTPTPDILSDGHITSISGQFGHVLIGKDTNIQMVFDIFRTDSSGNTGAAPLFFKNQYELSEAPMMSTTPNLRDLHSLEYSDKSGYAITGDYVSLRGTHGIFYQKINPVGAPTGSAVGYWAGLGYTNGKLCKTIESSVSPGDLYMVGLLNNGAADKNGAIFIIKIDMVGSTIWSRIYTSSKLFPQSGSTPVPYDITESTIPNSSGSYDVVVVGALNDSISATAATQNAFVLKADNLTGNLTAPVFTYGIHAAMPPNSNGPHVFTCITPTSNPNVDPTGAGYAIGGYAQRDIVSGGTNYNYWHIAIDHLGIVKWSNLYETGDPYEQVVDIVGRSLGTYEYYLAGNNISYHNMTVLKVNNLGNMMAHYQYGMPRYGLLWPSAWDKCASMDIWEGHNPGISVYGYSQALNPPMYGVPSSEYDYLLASSDFNGFSCVPDEIKTYQTPGPGSLEDVTFHAADGFFQYYPLYCTIYGHAIEDKYPVCESERKPAQENSVNASIAPDIVYPNPITPNDREIKININGERNENVSVTISNMVGQVLMKRPFTVNKGGNTLAIDISRLNLSSGIYNLNIQGQSFTKVAKFNVAN